MEGVEVRMVRSGGSERMRVSLMIDLIDDVKYLNPPRNRAVEAI